MKKWFAYVAIFFTSYFVFFIATLPAQFVLGQLTLPKNVGLYGVSGTIWRADVEQLTISNSDVLQVTTELSFWSLFTLSPKVDVTFGDALLAGPEGKLTLAISTEQLILSDVETFISANDIAQQIALPLPMTAKGEVELNLAELVIDLSANNECLQGAGGIQWSRAGVLAMEENIKLGKLSAKITCDQGAIALDIEPKNDLGLTFSAYVRLEKTKAGKISGQGHLKPGAKFPEKLKPALPFLGKADNKGRYRISI